MKILKQLFLVCAALLAVQTEVNAVDNAPQESAGPLVLDLTPFYKKHYVKDAPAYAGQKIIDGVPLNINGEIVFANNQEPGVTEVPGVRVGRKFDELHLVHAAKGADVQSRSIALVRFHYADGTTNEIPILYGGHIRDWQRLSSEEKETLTDPGSKIFYRGPGTQQFRGSTRLFKSTIANPSPQKVVITIDFISSQGFAAYVLHAATVANRDAKRLVSPAVPSEEPERFFNGEVTVHVVDDITKQPIEGVTVKPSMTIDGTYVTGSPVSTSAKGEAAIRYPTGRTANLFCEVVKEGWIPESYHEPIDLETTNKVEFEMISDPKITGTVVDASGKPVAGVGIIKFPKYGYSRTEFKTDAQGHFEAFANLHPRRVISLLIAQDSARNLVALHEIEESATNYDFILGPGLAVAGRVKDAAGRPLTNASVQVELCWGQDSMPLKKNVNVDANGCFELRGLPREYKYTFSASAEGYGVATQEVGEDATMTNRLELPAIVLPLADQRLAGRVVNANDDPVFGAMVHVQGSSQPATSCQTDTNGQFEVKVCEGFLSLSAGSMNAYGDVQAQAGETNVIIKIVQQDFQLNPRSSTKKTIIYGTVRHPNGKPASNLRVGVYPDWGVSRGAKVEANGQFQLEWNSQQFRHSSLNPFLMVRDEKLNLVATEPIGEDTTNVDLRLGKGLVLVAHAQTADGMLLTNATAQLSIWSDNSVSSIARGTFKANEKGQIEITALPSDHKYDLTMTAKGYGSAKQTREEGAEIDRVEMPAFVLKKADRRIAGMVVNEENRPAVAAWVHLNGEGQIMAHCRSDSNGRFSFSKICEGPVTVSASARNAHGNVQVEGGDTNVVVTLRSNNQGSESVNLLNITGVLRDPSGAPVPNCRITRYPSYNNDSVRTDENGHYKMRWSPQQIGASSKFILVARDVARNLVAAADLVEELTNLDLSFGPGMMLIGRVQDSAGKPLTNATARLMIETGNHSSYYEKDAFKVDGQGNFQIAALPPTEKFNITVRAKGYGSARQDIQRDEGQTNRIELNPFVLRQANRQLAGVILDVDENPVSGAQVNMHGDGQPEESVRTDRKGRFVFKEVCEGSVRLSAYSQDNGYRNADTQAQGGDTNVVLTLSSSGGRSEPPKRRAIKGNALPDLASVGLASDVAPTNKPVLLCLFDCEQRPSRRFVLQLAEQYNALREKGVTLLGAQAAITSAEVLKEWKDANLVPFPVGRVSEKTPKTKWVLSVESLPWLILTDAQGRVTAEGFALDELDSKLKLTQ